MITQPVTPEETERPRAVATIGVRVLNYLTNHVVNRVPSYSLRHAWYRRVLGLSMGRGSGVHLGCYVWFYGPGQLRRSGFHIGANTRINRDCCLDAGGFPLESRPVVIEDHVWIGMRAMILPGTTVGRGAVIAAGAVARGVIPPMTVVAGVPAHPIGTRPAEGIGYELDAPFPLFE
ncbi:MAG TPA: DapH/DapD/GlmU-related protein [Actinomycetota bacterium]|nr:DapH/DapD/GlmU-related protein [Actinomycetota bacterium]